MSKTGKKSNDYILLTQALSQNAQEYDQNITLNDYFEIFSAEQCLKHKDLDAVEIEDGIVDETMDGGIDSIYVFFNGDLVQDEKQIPFSNDKSKIELHIIQSKYADGFGEGAIEKIIASMRQILDFSRTTSSLKKGFNEKLFTTISIFRKVVEKNNASFPDISVSFYYCSLGDSGRINHPIKERLVILEDEVRSSLSNISEYNFHFYGAKELINLARQRPKTVFSVELKSQPIFSSYNQQRGYVALASIAEFYKILDDNGKLRKGIFESNVRDYEGNVSVNTQIRETLNSNKRDDFWWLNNGITIIANEINLNGDQLTFSHPQIVNGLQTSREIFNYVSSSGGVTEDRFVLIRLVATSSSESRDNIIRATNSQTSIPPTALLSTEKIHRDIEDVLKFNGIYYERRKNFYRNEGIPRKNILGVSELAQAIMSMLLLQPNQARARPSNLLKDDAQYKKMYNHKNPIDMYLSCAKMLKKVDSFLKTRGVSRKDANNMKFYILSYLTLREIQKQAGGSLFAVNPQDISNINVDSITEGDIEASLKFVKDLYNRLGGTDKVAKGPRLVAEVKASFNII